MPRISTFGDDERRPARRQVGLACLYLSYLALFTAAILGILAIWLPTGVPALVAVGVGVLLAVAGGGVLLPRRAAPVARRSLEAPEPAEPVDPPTRHSRPDGPSR